VCQRVVVEDVGIEPTTY